MMKQKTDIPNTEGFTFELVRPNGSKQIARVAVEPGTGCHFAATFSGEKIELAGFVGWEPIVLRKAVVIPGYAPRGSPYLYTRSQFITLRAKWNRENLKLPTVKNPLLIGFPEGADYPVARITVAEGKSTDGERLFACQFYGKA